MRIPLKDLVLRWCVYRHLIDVFEALISFEPMSD